jgi:hypothetical protein
MTVRDENGFELMEFDPVSGRSIWSYFDGEKTVYRTDYPVEATTAENEALRNEADRAWRGDWHRVASIPLNILHDSGLNDAQTQGDDKFVKRWLNDSDNRAWRTKDGHL